MSDIFAHLNQEDMEEWMKALFAPESKDYLQRGIMSQLGLEFVSCDFEKREAVFAFQTQSWQQNPYGILHGGITCTCFDSVMGILLHYFTKPFQVTTTNMRTDYLKPIQLGDQVVFQVKALSLGRTLSTLQAEAWIPERGVLAASAIASYMRLEPKK